MKKAGTREQCKEKVYSGRSFFAHRCRNRPKKDGYCGTHHPDTVKKRNEKIHERWLEREEREQQDAIRRGLNLASNQQLLDEVQRRSLLG